MNKLAIVGSGGHGRCCLDIARATGKYDEICFVDDANVGTVVNGTKIIGAISDIESLEKKEYEICVAIGNNEVRKQIMQNLQKKGFSFATLISPNSVVSDYATVKEGTVIYPGAIVEPNSYIGVGCVITAHVAVNHDAVVENYAIIYYNAVIRPNSRVSELAKIETNSVIEV